MEIINVIGVLITALATVGIYLFSKRQIILLEKFEEIRKLNEAERSKKDNTFREELSDLYKAIVISNLLSGNSDLKMTHDAFKNEYKGRVQIFS